MKKLKEKKIKKFLENQQDPISLDEVEIYGFGGPEIKFENITITKGKFGLLRLKDCVVRNCKITQSVISEQSYLRHAKFENVDFTGTTFIDSNLEKASFDSNCKLQYVKFDNCLVDSDNIIKNCLPQESNLRLGLLYQLYKNESSNGNIKKADEILYLIRETEKIEKRNTLFDKGDYFKNKRKKMSFGDKAKCFGSLLKDCIEKIIWGYGLNVLHIGVTMLAIILIFSAIYCVLGYSSQDNTICVLKALAMSINAFMIGGLSIGEDVIAGSILIKAIILLQNGIGILYFSLFTSAMYRRIAR